MRTVPPNLDSLAYYIHYNRETGEFFWQNDKPPNIKAGTRAGFRNGPKRDWYIMFEGRRYPAHHIAWYLINRHWPRRRLYFRDGDHDNLTLVNIASESSNYSMNPAAVAYRKRRAYLDQKRLELHVLHAKEIAWRGDVRFNSVERTWEVYASADERGGTRVLAKFDTQTEAVAYADEIQYAFKFIKTFPYIPQRGDDEIAAGEDVTRCPTYNELATLIAYDPNTGRFFYRRDPVQPLADKTNTLGRRVVTFWGRYFSVGMLAWFMTHRQWPRPKTIGFKDGNPSNAKLSNLYLIKR